MKQGLFLPKAAAAMLVFLLLISSACHAQTATAAVDPARADAEAKLIEALKKAQKPTPTPSPTVPGEVPPPEKSDVNREPTAATTAKTKSVTTPTSNGTTTETTPTPEPTPPVETPAPTQLPEKTQSKVSATTESTTITPPTPTPAPIDTTGMTNPTIAGKATSNANIQAVQQLPAWAEYRPENLRKGQSGGQPTVEEFAEGSLPSPTDLKPSGEPLPESEMKRLQVVFQQESGNHAQLVSQGKFDGALEISLKWKNIGEMYPTQIEDITQHVASKGGYSSFAAWIGSVVEADLAGARK